MKKFGIILCALLLAASLTACGGDQGTESDSDSATETSSRRPLINETLSSSPEFDSESASGIQNPPQVESKSEKEPETEKTYTEKDFKVVDETVYVTASELSYRTDSSSSSAVSGYLLCKESVKRIGYNETWSKVLLNGQVYYMYSRYLTTENITGNDFTMFDAAKIMYINADQVSVRLYPSRDNNFSTIMGYVAKDDEIICIGTNNTWYKVLYQENGKEDRELYIHSSCLSETKSTEQETTAGYDISDFKFYETPKTVTVTADTLNVRLYPSADNSISEIKGYVEKGKELTCYGDNGKWCQIDFKGNKYYVNMSHVTSNEEETDSGYDISDFTIYDTPVTMYVNTSLLAVRQYPDAGNQMPILDYLKKGTAVSCTGCNGDWYQISYNGRVAYVSVRYVSATKPFVDH